MALYRVVLRGENFLLNLVGEPELLGFHVTHYVKARSEEEAQRVATIITRKNQNLQRALLNTHENPTRIECEAIKRIWWPFFRRGGRYDFWQMGNEAEGSDSASG